MIKLNLPMQTIRTLKGILTHELSEMAHVEGTRITYPLYTKETLQRKLGDFGTA